TGTTAAALRPALKTSHKAAVVRAKPAPAKTPANTVTGTPAAATTPAPVADTLEAHGHQLMLNGDYSAAIPVLRNAVAAAPHTSLTYAYALYDLGRSLRLSGDPKDAVAVLYQRLQIPDQTETVREELQLALQALGQQANQSGGAVPGGGTDPGAGPAQGGGPAPGGGPAVGGGASGDTGSQGGRGHHRGHDGGGLFPGAAQPVPVGQGD
ncbi:MAG: tetratricopeptide repeat protein, partial [Solirubrobacterales bacterium]|nr:tetratricopeptide repeat protein [Solirubrobacterales bacterium]